MASDSFQLRVNHKQLINLTATDVTDLNLIKISENIYHLIDNDTSYTIEVVDSDHFSKSYTLRINGQLQEVSIKNSLDLLIDQMGLTISTTKDVKLVNAPMPGQIIAVEIEEGQEVNENDPILILEAMKMENVMLSPKSGKIKSIHVGTSQVVGKGQLLVEFE